MGIGVIADFMSPRGDFLHQLRIFVHPDAHQEEGCLGVVLVQQVENGQGFVTAPGGIEGDGDHLVFPFDGVNWQYLLRGYDGGRIRLQRAQIKAA